MPHQLALPFDTPFEDVIHAADASDDGEGEPVPVPFDSRRLVQMGEWLLEERPLDKLIDTAMKAWNVGESEVRRYLRRARRALRTPVRESREERIAVTVRKRRLIYRHAFAVGDHKAALAALKDENLLMGDYPDKVIRNAPQDDAAKTPIRPPTVEDILDTIPKPLRHLFVQGLSQPAATEEDDGDG